MFPGTSQCMGFEELVGKFVSEGLIDRELGSRLLLLDHEGRKRANEILESILEARQKDISGDAQKAIIDGLLEKLRDIAGAGMGAGVSKVEGEGGKGGGSPPLKPGGSLSPGGAGEPPRKPSMNMKILILVGLLVGILIGGLSVFAYSPTHAPIITTTVYKPVPTITTISTTTTVYRPTTVTKSLISTRTNTQTETVYRTVTKAQYITTTATATSTVTITRTITQTVTKTSGAPYVEIYDIQAPTEVEVNTTYIIGVKFLNHEQHSVNVVLEVDSNVTGLVWRGPVTLSPGYSKMNFPAKSVTPGPRKITFTLYWQGSLIDRKSVVVTVYGVGASSGG